MMLGIVLLVVFWVGTGFCVGCYEPENYCCLDTVNEGTCTSHNLIMNVSWNTNTSTPGLLEVEFPLSYTGCTEYKVILLFLNSTENDCVTANTSKGLKHTQMKFNIINNCTERNGNMVQTCGKTAVVAFKHVFQGCYSLKITPYKGSNSRRSSYSSPRYIQNNHTLAGLQGPTPVFSQQYFRAKGLVARLHSSDVQIDNIQYKIELRYNSWSTLENVQLSGWHLKCSSSTSNCHSVTSPNVAPFCKVLTPGSMLECNFFDIPPGNYCIVYYIDDERCCSESVWSLNHTDKTDMCIWHHDFQVNSSLTEDPRVTIANQQDEYIVYIIVVVVASIVILIVIMIAIVLRSYILGERRRTYPPVSETPLDSIVPVQPYKILLLYARDCQPFMDLMGSLREVLEEETKSEVIDCLDPSRWNEVGRNPMEWIRCHIEQKNTKVVLIATNCAYLRQQAHMKQAVITYKEPDAYDNLFLYGLKALEDNFTEYLYRKISVVRFDGFSDDENLFNYITPNTRFVLPTHLTNLICNLQPNEALYKEIFPEETKEVEKLKQDLSNLIDFKNKNVDYLQDMLLYHRQDLG